MGDLQGHKSGSPPKSKVCYTYRRLAHLLNADIPQQARLERIRNNQRRSRAKRAEHVAELEARLRAREELSGPKPDQPSVSALVEENRLLKQLLISLGIGENFLQTYIKAAEAAERLSSADSMPVQMTSISPTVQSPISLHNKQSPSSEPAPSKLTPRPNAPSSPVTAVSWPQQPYSPLTTLATVCQLPCQAGPGEPSNPHARCLPDSDPDSASTLCLLALDFVMSNNKKGYSRDELEKKLRAGYRCGGSADEGCRVDNKVLFNVLAEIS